MWRAQDCLSVSVVGFWFNRCLSGTTRVKPCETAKCTRRPLERSRSQWRCSTEVGYCYRFTFRVSYATTRTGQASLFADQKTLKGATMVITKIIRTREGFSRAIIAIAVVTSFGPRSALMIQSWCAHLAVLLAGLASDVPPRGFVSVCFHFLTNGSAATKFSERRSALGAWWLIYRQWCVVFYIFRRARFEAFSRYSM